MECTRSKLEKCGLATPPHKTTSFVSLRHFHTVQTNVLPQTTEGNTRATPPQER